MVKNPEKDAKLEEKTPNELMINSKRFSKWWTLDCIYDSSLSVVSNSMQHHCVFSQKIEK